MSRRRVSVRDLGVVDCQGWLLRRKEGRSFLGSKWKKYWFVLKKSSLYWYTCKMAEKAEGFINLSGFTIEQAQQCRKKHLLSGYMNRFKLRFRCPRAITASHPLVVTIFIAAESFTDMNKWISKLSKAAEPCELINTEECYSEESDQDGDECLSTSLNSGQETADSKNPLCESSPCTSSPPTTPTGENRGSSGGGASLPLLHVGEETQEVIPEKPPDEMECLYNHLKAASLSPIGQSINRDFRASFVRRCQNDKVNDKLHLLRILSSTLKAKELELLAVDQILTDPTLAATTYRKWRLSNYILLQEIAKHKQAAGGAAELRPQATVTPR